VADKVRQINSVLNPKQADPHDVAIAAINEACQQIGHADNQPPRPNERVSRLEQGAARRPSNQQKRLAVPRRQLLRDRLALPLRGLIGLLMAACIGAAAIGWQSHGDAAREMIARWAPQLGLISLPAPENPVTTQPSPPAVPASAAEAAPPEPTPPAPPSPRAQTAPEDAAPASIGPSLGQAQPLQWMASDLAAVEQEIEQLKASIKQLKSSQEQMVRDNAELAEQLKAAKLQMARDNENAAGQLRASQEQMARLIAKASEQSVQPKTSAPPAPPIAPRTSKLVPKLSSPQARAHPPAPMPRRPAQQ
jgi:hypothetical protein